MQSRTFQQSTVQVLQLYLIITAASHRHILQKHVIVLHISLFQRIAQILRIHLSALVNMCMKISISIQ